MLRRLLRACYACAAKGKIFVEVVVAWVDIHTWPGIVKYIKATPARDLQFARFGIVYKLLARLGGVACLQDHLLCVCKVSTHALVREAPLCGVERPPWLCGVDVRAWHAHDVFFI